MFENIIIIWDRYILSQLEVKSDERKFLLFFSDIQGRASLISIWNSHASQTYNIQLKHIVWSWEWR